jgi:prepilin-type N-terminal cleavage/methylation domain-containing protein
MRSNRPSQRRTLRGFTLVELMVAIGIIALTAALGLPALARARKRSQNAALVNELRTNWDAFQMYIADTSRFPPSAAGFSAVPTGMAAYMPKKGTWTTTTIDGGRWYWWRFHPWKVWGFSGLIGVYNTNFNPEDMQLIDSSLDDGNGATGNIRVAGTWVYFGVN